LTVEFKAKFLIFLVWQQPRNNVLAIARPGLRDVKSPVGLNR